MKCFFNYSTAMLLMVLCISCGTDSGKKAPPGSVDQVSEVTSSSQDTFTASAQASNVDAANIDIISTDLLAQHFDTEALEMISVVKQAFDKELQDAVQSGRSLADAYKMNGHSLKSDFLQDHPIILNFPYNDKLSLLSYAQLPGFSSVWSDKCGYADDEGNALLRYYCLDTRKSVFSYFKDLGKQNEMIKGFVDNYLKNQEFDVATQQGVILESEDNIEFNNLDNQVFWMIYHLSLHETRSASNRLLQIQKSK